MDVSNSGGTSEQVQPVTGGHLKGFVTQSQLDEKRKTRQEEWEKVRKPEQPLEVPEEEYDARSLYHRLQEQKDKKQAEFEEAHKLKNMIKGLDDDEVNFLDFVDKTREEMEIRRLREEGREIAEYRKAVATLAEESEGQRLQELKNATAHSSRTTQAPPTQRRTSQSALLAGAVKRKSIEKTEEVEDSKKRLKLESDVESNTEVDTSANVTVPPNFIECAGRIDQLTCIGVLPGLGVYTDSSDTDDSSDDGCSDIDILPNSTGYDLLGRSRTCQVTQAVHAQSSAGGKG